MPADMADTIVSMAMTAGGFIVHGVNAELRITGCPRSQNTMDRIMRIANECHVGVQTKALLVDDLELTVTAVPEIRDRIVTTPDGRLLRRNGGDCQPVRGDAMASFVRQKVQHPAEGEPVEAIEPADFDIAAVNRVLQSDGKPPVKKASLYRALEDLGVAAPPSPPLGTRVLLAGAVLFASEPDKFVSGASVQLVRRIGIGPGPGPSSARVELSGPLGDVLDRCLLFIEAHTQSYEAVVGTRRETISEYPEAALREAILNALAHRDYGLIGSTIDITVWDDRIEVKSPGLLPGHITVDHMAHAHFSRNRRIMRVLKTAGLVEEYGEGMERMRRAMTVRLMEPPTVTADSSSVTVTLRNRILGTVEDQVWLALLDDYDMSELERRALVAVGREGGMTPRRLRELLPEVDAPGVLAGAVEKGLLIRTGERGGTRYQLPDEIVRRAGSSGLAEQMRKRQRLLDEIRRRGSLSTVEGVQLLGEPLVVVREMLNELVQDGLARAEGRTRARRYYPAA